MERKQPYKEREGSLEEMGRVLRSWVEGQHELCSQIDLTLSCKTLAKSLRLSEPHFVSFLARPGIKSRALDGARQELSTTELILSFSHL
jgi:hypothetical protein